MIKKIQYTNSRKIQAQETKTRIYETAVAMFKEYGFDNVTVESITNAAGVSKGTFYLYFKAKHTVLAELFHKIDNSYKDVFSKIDKSMPASEQILLLANTMADYCATVVGINLIKIVYMNQISLERKQIILTDPNRYLYKLLSEITKTGMERGEFRNDLSQEKIIMLISRSMRALLYDWCLYDDVSFDLQHESQTYFAHVLDMICANCFTTSSAVD